LLQCAIDYCYCYRHHSCRLLFLPQWVCE